MYSVFEYLIQDPSKPFGQVSIFMSPYCETETRQVQQELVSIDILL